MKASQFSSIMAHWVDLNYMCVPNKVFQDYGTLNGLKLHVCAERKI